jgi:hypothetical protein
MATVILIEANELARNSILGGNIDVDKLWPAVKACQKTLIKPLLTEALYNKISDDYFNDNLTGIYLTMYEDYIKDLIVYGSAAIYIGSGGAYQISNLGIVKASTENSEALSKNDVDYLYNFNKQLFDGLKEEFLKWLKDNPVPEYTATCSTNSQRLLGGWLLTKRKKNC